MARAGGQREMEPGFRRRCSRPAEHGDHFYAWSKGGSTSLQNFVARSAGEDGTTTAGLPHARWFGQRRRTAAAEVTGLPRPRASRPTKQTFLVVLWKSRKFQRGITLANAVGAHDAVGDAASAPATFRRTILIWACQPPCCGVEELPATVPFLGPLALCGGSRRQRLSDESVRDRFAFRGLHHRY